MAIATLVTEGVFTPEELAAMQAILDEVCLARQYPLGSPQREDLAFRLIALYQAGARDEARLKNVLIRRRYPGQHQ